jgi:hypothetical protein
MKRRMVILFALLASIAALAGTAVLRPDDREALAPPTPSLIGLTQREATCVLQMRNRSLRVTVDDAVAPRVDDAICTGRAKIRPDPPVERQVPEAGAPLREDGMIRLYTSCFKRNCL